MAYLSEVGSHCQNVNLKATSLLDKVSDLTYAAQLYKLAGDASLESLQTSMDEVVAESGELQHALDRQMSHTQMDPSWIWVITLPPITTGLEKQLVSGLATDNRTQLNEFVAQCNSIRATIDSGHTQQGVERLNSHEFRSSIAHLKKTMTNLMNTEQALSLKQEQINHTYEEKLGRFPYLGLILSIAVAVTLSILFSRSTTLRLETLIDNTRRLARGEALNPRIQGGDEISQLDTVFHDMAIALDEANKKQTAVVNNAVDVICSIDSDGIFAAINPASVKVWKFQPAELIGRRFIDVIHSEDKEKVQDLVRAAKEGSATAPFETRCIRKDGSVIETLWSASWSANEKALFCIVHDITERKRLEQRLNVQYAASRILHESESFDDAILQVFLTTCQLLGWDLGRLWRVDAETDSLRCVQTFSREDGLEFACEPVTLPGTGVLGCVSATRKPFWAPDFLMDSSYGQSGLPAHKEWHGAFAYPISLRSQLLAVVELFSSKIEVRDEDLMQTFISVDQQIGLFFERKQSEEALKESETRTRAVIDSMLDALIIVDESGTIESINPSGEKMFGYSKDYLFNKNMGCLFPASVQKDGDAFLSNLKQKALGRIGEWECVRGDGETFPIEVSMNELATADGQRFSVNIRDTSERHEVDRLKKEFVSIVSHELRTPLSSIQGSLSLLADGVMGDLSEDAAKMVAIADRNAGRLITLINDILDLERLESGRMEFDFADVPLSVILGRALDAVRGFADRKGVLLRLHDTPAVAHADGDRLVQVLVNLLSNAIKFSPEGSVVSMDATEVSGWVTVRVTDQGRGIPAAHLQAIFEKFQQVEAADTRREGGTGLGLAICKAIIERHDGTIGVTSAEGTGSTFWFNIPGKPAVGDTVADDGKHAAGTSQSHHKV